MRNSVLIHHCFRCGFHGWVPVHADGGGGDPVGEGGGEVPGSDGEATGAREGSCSFGWNFQSI